MLVPGTVPQFDMGSKLLKKMYFLQPMHHTQACPSCKAKNPIKALPKEKI
jgi:hypothetical protein